MGIVFSACDEHDVIKTCILFSVTKNDLFELICLKMICLLYYTYTLNTRKKYIKRNKWKGVPPWCGHCHEY